MPAFGVSAGERPELRERLEQKSNLIIVPNHGLLSWIRTEQQCDRVVETLVAQAENTFTNVHKHDEHHHFVPREASAKWDFSLLELRPTS